MGIRGHGNWVKGIEGKENWKHGKSLSLLRGGGSKDALRVCFHWANFMIFLYWKPRKYHDITYQLKRSLIAAGYNGNLEHQYPIIHMKSICLNYIQGAKHLFHLGNLFTEELEFWCLETFETLITIQNPIANRLKTWLTCLPVISTGFNWNFDVARHLVHWYPTVYMISICLKDIQSSKHLAKSLSQQSRCSTRTC